MPDDEPRPGHPTLIEDIRHALRDHPLIDEILSGVRTILERLPRSTRATRELVLLMPIRTNLLTGEIIMADIQLPLNQSYTAVLTEFNSTTKGFDPVAPTDTFTAAPSDAVNMSATIAPFVPPAGATPSQTALAGIPAVTVQWLHAVTPMPTGVSVTISDSAGNTPDTGLAFDMLAANVVPDQIGVDTADAVFATIPTPV
jgi:hypothetical protein